MKNAHPRAGRLAVPAPAALLAASLLVACVPLQPPGSAQVEQVTPQPVAQPPAAPAVAPAAAPAGVAAPAAASPETLRALEQLTELKEELKRLLNAVEEIQFDRDREAANRETTRWQRENLFQDMDRRILKLERDTRLLLTQPPPAQQPPAPGTALAPVIAPALDPVVPGIGDSAIALDISGGGPADTAAAGGAENGAVATVAAVGAAGAAGAAAPDALGAAADAISVPEQQAYDQAFGLLKQSRYEDAIDAFQRLADTWPDGQLADDAVYWKSEAQYVNREYAAALDGFTTVVTRYPDSARLPEALLKTGTIQYDIGAYQEAAAIFRDILERFPDHQVAVSAHTRLRRIEQTIQ